MVDNLTEKSADTHKGVFETQSYSWQSTTLADGKMSSPQKTSMKRGPYKKRKRETVENEKEHNIDENISFVYDIPSSGAPTKEKTKKEKLAGKYYSNFCILCNVLTSKL